jgi:hypothetical protein
MTVPEGVAGSIDLAKRSESPRFDLRLHAKPEFGWNRTFPDLQDPQFDRFIHASQTLAVAAALRSAGGRAAPDPVDAEHVVRVAAKLELCAVRQRRCNIGMCPRCAAFGAKRHRRRLQTLLAARTSEAQHGFGLLTVTFVHRDAGRAMAQLAREFASLRRRALFTRAVRGGEGHFQLVPTNELEWRWNAHWHSIVELNSPFAAVPVAQLAAGWSDRLHGLGHAGSLDLREIDPASIMTESRDGRSEAGDGFAPVCFYVTRRARSELVGLTDAQLVEYVCAHHRRRTVSRFGLWRGWRAKAARVLPARTWNRSRVEFEAARLLPAHGPYGSAEGQR